VDLLSRTPLVWRNARLLQLQYLRAWYGTIPIQFCRSLCIPRTIRCRNACTRAWSFPNHPSWYERCTTNNYSGANVGRISMLLIRADARCFCDDTSAKNELLTSTMLFLCGERLQILMINEILCISMTTSYV